MRRFHQLPQIPAVKPLVSLIAIAVLSACAVTPAPITVDAAQKGLAAERAVLVRDQEPVTSTVSLDEAIARSLKYNLDYRLKLMEEALAQKQLDLSRADLLPRLVLGAGYSDRNNENGYSSQNLATGTQSVAPSTSTDKSVATADLGLSWNVLDFGVSYYAQQQQADRWLMAQERRRKTVHLVMQQVRQAYWQAAGAQLLASKIGPVIVEARKALADSRKIESEKLQSPLETLNYQRQLLDIIRQLEAINDELSLAKPRLASLMNIEPGTEFALEIPAALNAPMITLSIDKMEDAALSRRPELMEARYNERIGALETRKAMAKLMPGLDFSIAAHYDSNSFLVNNTWANAGLRVSWNLVNLFNASTILDTADVQAEIATRQRMALSMAVLTQTHVAYRDFNGRLRQYQLSSELDNVEQRILVHTRNATRNDAQGKLQEVRVAASALMSELRLYQTYGALQGAYGQVLSTMGLDPLPPTIDSHDLSAIRGAVRSMESRWAQELGGGV